MHSAGLFCLQPCLRLCSSYLGITLGFVSLIAFTCLWRHVKVYLSRLYLKQVAFKPPSVPKHTLCGWTLPWYARRAARNAAQCATARTLAASDLGCASSRPPPSELQLARAGTG